MHGSRMPPSQVLALPERNRPAEPPFSLWISDGPLSLENTVSVSSARPSSFRVLRISPTLQSISSTTSPYGPRLLLPANFGLGWIGTCGMVYGKYRKNGCLGCSL